MASQDDTRLSFVSNHRQRFILKLIKLYEQNECLWNIWNKDFLNIPLKQTIWETIANDMGNNVTVDSIKRRIHRMCYNVNLEKLHQREAVLLNDVETPQKLYYSDKFKFINSVSNKSDKIVQSQTPQSTWRMTSLERMTNDYTIRKNLSQGSRLKLYEKMRNPQVEKVRHTTYKRLKAASETPSLTFR